MDKVDPLALLCFQSEPDFYPLSMFAPREVFVGPDCQTGRDRRGTLCQNITPGEYDLAEVVKQLDVTPDIVVIKPDATGRNVPRNIGAVPGIKVLIVGDTHHLVHPISWMQNYAFREPFDVMICHHARQHVHFIAHAGLKAPCYWIPLLSVNPYPQPVAPRMDHFLSFVGDMGRWHPYRRHILDKIKESGLPLHTGTVPQDMASSIYARSTISLNISLNGDINHRVGEVLAAGGFLLTDRLAPESGLETLLEDGKHLAFYSGLEELTDKIGYYLAHPSEAKAIRMAGQTKFMAEHNPGLKRRQFLDLVFEGKAAEGWDLSCDPRHRHAIPADALDLIKRVEAYEEIQELHRCAVTPGLRLGEGIDPAYATDAVDLPRLSIATAQDSELFALTGTKDRIKVADPHSWHDRDDAGCILLAKADQLSPQRLESAPPTILLPDSLFDPLSGEAIETLKRFGYRNSGRIAWRR
ncbi:MAG: glycosyltransferase family 1 protein, partial [Rhodospirillales bacterium]